MTGTFSCHRFSCHIKTNKDDIISFLCAFAASRLCAGTQIPSLLLVKPRTDVSPVDFSPFTSCTVQRASWAEAKAEPAKSVRISRSCPAWRGLLS